MYFVTYFYDTHKSRNYIKMINDPIKSYCIKVGNMLVPVDHYDSQLNGELDLECNFFNSHRGKTELVSTKKNTKNQGLILVKNAPSSKTYGELIDEREDTDDIELILIVLNKKNETCDFLYLKGAKGS